MPCYHPITGYRSSEVNKTGKRSLVFSVKKGYADLPVTIACGQCIGCRLERSRQWAVRLVHEGQLHEEKCFLTLTYDNEHLPENGSLDKTHFQKFMKRLRKSLGSKQIRYFHCGEYGEQGRRPHYHCILFGHEFSDLKRVKTNVQGDDLYESQTLNDLWGMGNCWIGNVTFESCAYVARYILKKVTGEQADDHYKMVDLESGEIHQLQPEYVTMSRRPGIAQGWYDKFKTDVWKNDAVVVRGKEMPPPRRYMLLKEAEDPIGHASIKRSRAIRGFRNRANATPERLRVREEIKLSKIQMLKRTL